MSLPGAIVTLDTYAKRKQIAPPVIERTETAMTHQVEFVQHGTPTPKGRPRSTKTGRHYTPASTRTAEQSLLAAYRLVAGARPPHTGPVEVHLEAVFVPATSWPKWKRDMALAGQLPHTTKPDLDNLLKLVDGLNGHAWADDAQIFRATPEKRYGPAALTRVVITFHPAPTKPERTKQ